MGIMHIGRRSRPRHVGPLMFAVTGVSLFAASIAGAIRRIFTEGEGF